MNNESNFPEDFQLENGNYQVKCSHCEQLFLGYKRRFYCKKCQNQIDIFDNCAKEQWIKLSNFLTFGDTKPSEIANYYYEKGFVSGAMFEHKNILINNCI